MKGIWWIGKDELDDAQKRVITLHRERSALIIGPPGSGKTNLLLLRANYLHLAGLKNIVVLVFTKTLRSFMALGGTAYDFPHDKIMTSARFYRSILWQNGIVVDDNLSGLSDSTAFMVETIEGLIQQGKLGNCYDAILLDEAQDYSLRELNLFRKLTPRLLMAADKKQNIYEHRNGVSGLSALVDEECELIRHYRNGENICKVADGLGQGWGDYRPMLAGCNYNEESMPSTVETERCAGIEDEVARILSRLEIQVKAYPDELIGVLVPRNKELDAVWDAVSKSKWGERSMFCGTDEQVEFRPDTPICVATIHAAKGLEFRAVHLAATQYIKRFPYQRELAFTAVTRCKTSLTVYHSGALPGFFEAALQCLKPESPLPVLEDVFGNGQ